MKSLKEFYKSGDWKSEKHVPFIDVKDNVQKGNSIPITVSIGNEIAHPNTTEHHINWIEIYFHPDNEKFPYQIGRYEFSAHGASIEGANISTVFSEPNVSINFKSDKSGTIIATAYCNIHGLWENSKAITVS